jgi:prefoldin subunit 5
MHAVSRMPSKFDLEAVVQHHDSQLEAFGNRMGVVEKTLTAHSSVLQEIKDAVVKQGARPTFDPRNTIGIVKDIGVVFAMVCAGILYLAAQNGSADIALMKDRVERLLTRMDKMESLVLPQSWAAVTKP